VKRWIKSLLQNRDPGRRLEVTASGRWYLGLTIALGVLALVTGNNVFFLIESLLLSGLIFSGILSERTVAAVHLIFRRGRAIAGQVTGDEIILQNKKNFPLFCIEIGEWVEGKFISFAFIPRLGAHQSLVVESRQVLKERGHHVWDGVCVGTSYPFGFARKIRIIWNEGKRIVWPARKTIGNKTSTDKIPQTSNRAGSEQSEGEVRVFNQDDDARLIVWTLSARGNELLVRQSRSNAESPHIKLDLTQALDPTELEKKVIQAAQPFHLEQDHSFEGTLVLIDGKSKTTVHGKDRALDQLALIRKKPA
jgi:uncharacterized protein (DUF58 family)